MLVCYTKKQSKHVGPWDIWACFSLMQTCIELQVVGRPPMRCLRSGGRMLSRILFSCSRAAEEGPRLLTTLEAEMTRGELSEGWRGLASRALYRRRLGSPTQAPHPAQTKQQIDRDERQEQDRDRSEGTCQFSPFHYF